MLVEDVLSPVRLQDSTLGRPKDAGRGRAQDVGRERPLALHGGPYENVYETSLLDVHRTSSERNVADWIVYILT